MFDLFRTEAESHYTDGGSIYCPVRKADMDVDYCLGCSRLVDARKTGRTLVIRCTGSAPAPGTPAL